MRAQYDVVCPTLIGRDQQIAGIQGVLSRARVAGGQVALIVGEAGVGKSRLLRAMTDEAREAGYFVLQGASFEAERSIPYAPLLDLVRLFAGSAAPAVVQHVLAPAAAEMVTLFPELRPILPEVTPIPSVDPESDKRRLFHALAQAITLLSRRQPVFLAFEDVHWTDDATLELIFHLARSHASQPVAIALTYRREEMSERLERLIADLDRARVSVELPVERLGRDEVGAMLNAIFGPHESLGESFLASIHGLTEGNPFFVEETLKALVIAGDLSRTSDGWRALPLERVRVPRTAMEAVRRRLAALTVPARGVASSAAVAGRRFDFALLQAITRYDEPALLSLVKELIAAQLVVEESPDRFAFRHALTREAIYTELLARERVALHREVAAALERAHTESPDAVVEALAYHAWEAGDWEPAARYAAQAARHALGLSAPREALEHLSKAFAASDRVGIEVPIELNLARGRAHETLGDFQRADASFTTALERARLGSDRDAEWEGLHALGKLWAARDYTRAGEYRRDALRVARELDKGALVARSLNRVGNWHVNLEEPQAGLPHHEEALAIFERIGDADGIAETVDLIAMTHHCDGAQRDAAIHYERSVRLFSGTDNRRGLGNALALVTLCGPSHHASSTTPFRSDIGAAELEAVHSVRLARDIGWRAGEAFATFIVADCLAWRGEYDRALPMARDAVRHAAEIEHLEWSAGTRRLLGTILLDLLAPKAALEHFEEAYAIAHRLGSRIWIRWAGAPLAIARARNGDLAGATDVLDRAAVVGDSNASPTPADSNMLTLGEKQIWLARAEVALASSQPDVALAIADARLASERAANPDSLLGVPLLSLVRAEALVALERFDEAALALGQAHAEAGEQHARPVLWRIEAATGHLHRLQRQRLEARRSFDAARTIAEELADQVPDADLRSGFRSALDAILPAAPPPTAARLAKSEFGGLTRRERDVAEHIAQGKTNKQIARDLGIGERTVEGYVTSALAKLGFGSRTQLAAWVAERVRISP